MIERQKKFSIGKKTFTCQFPNVGQIMYYALDIVDAIAFLQVCVPSVAKYYDIKNYTALAPEDIKELVEVYQEELKPWFDNVMAELKGIKLNNGGDKSEEEVESGEEG